jgi:DNA-binding NtrC family response regulator
LDYARPVTETILLVDDDQAFREAYVELLGADGYQVVTAASAPEVIPAFERSDARVCILDLMLPPTGRAEEGIALAAEILGKNPATKVIVVSGTGDTEIPLQAVQRGAYDFLAKPVDPDVLLAVVARAVARLELEDRVVELETKRPSDEGGLLGGSPIFLEARKLCERAAPTDVPVLIAGESGTGKEVFAHHLHARSRRAGRPFVAINCGALAATLLESTLFGHKKGAFTGATNDSPGLLVEADGGTLFLDEIGDMDLALQVKLLRALETGEVLPVGATKPRTVDVRVVSATHRPLETMTKEKTFREDLYWRIRGIEIGLPRLAERIGDLPVLAQHFLNQARTLVPRAGSPRLSGGALRRLESYGWPGNLRELRHEMQRALVMAGGRQEILEEDLSPSLRRPAATSEAPAELEGATLEEKIAQLEQREITAALRALNGNRSQAALRLGLSRQGLLNKIERYGLK